MIRFYLTVVFSLFAMAGFGLILYGFRLKPHREGSDDPDEPILLDFAGSTKETPGVFDLEMDRESLARGEKKAFDPQKHLPETIETLKKE